MVGSVVQMVVASLHTDIAPVQMVVVAIVDDSITGAGVCCCQPK